MMSGLFFHRKCCRMPRPGGGDECSDFENPIGRTFLSGNPHFRRDWKVSAIREAPLCGQGGSLNTWDPTLTGMMVKRERCELRVAGYGLLSCLGY